jgi:nitrogen regulatory protein PII
MENEKIITSFGYITKVELLHTLNSNILENSFVLENFESFPGYHGGDLPSQFNPHHLFLVTKKEYTYEHISRASERIRSNCKIGFGARPAELFIFNKKTPAIRIKDLQSFEQITELQKWYMDEGVFFAKQRKFNNEGIIKVMKQFDLNEVEEGIFIDKEEPLMSYLKVPVKLSWKVFETITYSIKNNLENNNFDAAQGVIFVKGVTDVVRIYTKEHDLAYLSNLRALYLEGIRKVHL